MLRALCSSQGKLQTAQRKASPQLTVYYTATPMAPSFTVQSPLSFLPSHTFPRDWARSAGSSTHISVSSYWGGVSFHRGHRTLGIPCLQCHPLGTLVPLAVDVRWVIWWEWGQGVHSQRVLVTLNHHRCEPGKRGKGQEASIIHGIGCQPRANGILVFLGAGLTALIPITVMCGPWGLHSSTLLVVFGLAYPGLREQMVKAQEIRRPANIQTWVTYI